MLASYPRVLEAQRKLYELQVEYIGALENVWTNGIALEGYLLTDGLEAGQPNSPAADLAATGHGWQVRNTSTPVTLTCRKFAAYCQIRRIRVRGPRRWGAATALRIQKVKEKAFPFHV